MKKISKALSVFLAVLMVLTAAPLSGFVGLEIELPEWPIFEAKAADEYLTSGFCGEVTETTDGTQISWELSDEGVLTITGEGRMAPEAFNYDLRVKEVVIGDGITNISDFCFNYCSNLAKVTMGDDVEVIGSSAFFNCDKLKNIQFFDSLIKIESAAFTDCDGLEEVVFNDGLLIIERNAFWFCRNLKAIELPDSITTIESSAFSCCHDLETVRIGVDATSIAQDAFSSCSSLSAIYVDEENLKYSSVSGILYDKAKTKAILVPAAVKGEILIPATVEAFTYKTIFGCNRVTDITIEEGSLKYKSIDGVVYSADGKTLIACPGGKNGKVTIPYGVEVIGEQAFYSCKILDEVSFPNTLLHIENSAFGFCEDLETLVLPESLITIGRDSFSRCHTLETVIFPDSLETIDDGAFSASYNLKSVTFGSNVFRIASNAFSNCSNFSLIEVSESNQNYSSFDGILYNKTKTKLVIVPSALAGEVTIPATVEDFTYNAVQSCGKITAINIEEGNAKYKSIDGIVYSADGKTVIVCPRGKKGAVTIADGTEKVEAWSFYFCKSITSVRIPDTVYSIERLAFNSCSSLATVSIPKSITKINNDMFDSCGFTELTFPETVQSFDHASWSNLKTFTILNRYCEYTSTSAPSFAKGCTIRAYCGSPGHEIAVKRMVNFESIGHTYLDWYIVSPATYEADGIERRDCAYCDGYDERIIPKLENEVFTANFVADGKTVATVDFPKGTTEIAEPAVPAKNRYMGEWEDYTLANADITINAVYTLIKSDDASEIETESEAIHYTDKDDVLFRFKAWADATVVKSTISKSVPLDIVLVVDQSGSMDETLGGRTKKVDALKDTAKDFVNTVFENAKMTDADHRISLVGFGLSGNYQGYEKNENTELLTSANGIVKFDNIKTTDYASSLLSVNVDGEVNDKLITAIDSIGARGATAADLGFEMAKGVFANTDSTERQRVVIFMTDGEPTYMSGFQTSVANSAIANASVLKKNFDASVFSVGVFSDSDSRNTNINKFMNAVSSGYPDAVSMNYMGNGVDGQYYLTVNNTDSLTSVFTSISTESLSHTAPFDNLTVIKTLSEYVTLTSKQEEQLRIDLIRKYGITNDDIIITRNADGTTTVQINSLTPYEVTDEEGDITYEVEVEFFASLNEKANTAGDYIVDTEDSGVMLGEDAKGYEATFDTSAITIDSSKTRVIFTINGEVYEVSENLSNGYAVAPEFEIAEDWQFSGWDTASNKATNGLVLDAALKKAERTVTWHTAEGDIVQTYVEGDFIKAPVVEYNADGDTFLSWDKSIPTTMPDENLEFTAVYGKHVHNYTSAVTKRMTCETDGVRTYICFCGDTYYETITATGHNYEALTPSLEKEDSKCTFCCTNCGDKYDYALNYEVVESTGKKTRVLYEFDLTDDELSTDIQPDGAIQIRIPLSELHGSAEKVIVIRTNDDGSKTQVPAVHEKGFLVITCDHFTPYEVIFDIPCEGHIQGEWVIEKEPTCSEEGIKYALCTECEKRVFEEAINKLSHTESDWIVDEDSTCAKEGSKHKICTVCKTTVKTEVIQKLSHSYSETVIAPTCSERGYTTYTCACGDSYVADFVAETGHYDNNSDNVCDGCSTKLKSDDVADNCSCNCHKGGFSGFIWKILCFFYKLFGMNKTCGCGVVHY